MKRALILAAAVAWFVSTVEMPAAAASTAYNDFLARSGDPTTSITTNNFNGPTSGTLVDFSNGSSLAAALSITPVAGQVGDYNNPTQPPPGSDAYAAFNGKVGVTNYMFINTGASNIGPYSIQLTGLDQNAAYSIVLLGSRGLASASYSNRWMSVTVSDVDTFTNNSSAGAALFARNMANDSAEFMAGTINGEVWRFDGLKSGSDGDLQLDLYARGTNGQAATFYANALMVQQFDGTSTNAGGSSGSGENTTRYLKGTQEASSPVGDWRNRIFTNAAEWTAGSFPFGYGDAVTYGTTLSDMINTYQCVFVRVPFVVTNAASVASIDITVDFDDGFMGWINGTQVVNSNEPASIVYNTGGMPSHESLATGGAGPIYTNHLVSVGSLVTGTNILALQVWNTAIGNGDLYLDSTISVTYNSSGGSGTGSVAATASAPALPAVAISEWMSFNRSFSTDNAGDNDAWIELRNTTATNISLQNWRLANSVSNYASGFSIPSGYSLAGGARQVIWLDNETGETSGGNLHANYVLEHGHGTIALFNPTGGLVDVVLYEPQPSDHSSSRREQGTYCDSAYPTPGASENTLEVVTPVYSNGTMSVTTDTQLGHGYRIEYVTLAGATNWQSAGTFIGSGAAMTTNLPATTGTRFYRVVKLPNSANYIPTTNVAAVATALNSGANLIKTASLSQTVGGTSGGSFDNMRDGLLDWVSQAWYPDRLHGAKIRATWGSPTTVDRIWLFGGGSIFQGIERGRVWLSDGSMFEFGPVPDRSFVPGLEVSFPARPVTWVEVEITQGRGRGGNPGIAEWAIFNGMPAGVTHTDWFNRQNWDDAIPAGCPIQNSTSVTGMVLTGRHIEYQGADTWYPVRGTNGYMYSPYADGWCENNGVTCYGAANTPYQTTTTGNAKILGSDPMDLQLWALNSSSANTGPYHARYPAGSLIFNGIWFYGTYVCNYNSANYSDGAGTHEMNWPICGAFCGFRYSSDYGQNWTDTSPYPRNGQMGLYDEPSVGEGPIKFGTPHFADCGENLEYSPDGYAYLCGHGTQSAQTNRFSGTAYGNVSWITGDGAYLSRIYQPTPGTINNGANWQFFAGLSGTNATWTSDINAAQPIVWWDNHMGCVTITYNPGLKKWFMCVTDGRYTSEDMDSYVLESDHVYGPYKMVNYMAAFGEQGYFLNLPSAFASADGKTAWLSYSANFRGWGTDHPHTQPEASRYAWCLVEVQFLTP